MNYYRFPDKTGFKVCFMVYLLAVQLLARSSMVTSVFLDFMPSQFLMIGLILAAGVVFLLYNRRSLKQILSDRRILAVIAVTVLVMGVMLLKRDMQMLYFSILLYMYFAIFINFFLPLQEAARYYVVMIFALSAYALLGQFVLKPMVHMGLLPRLEFNSPGGWHMFNFGLAFTVDKNTENVNALRLFGIFREPGLYQIFLFIAIQLNNYTVQWKKQWQMWAVNLVLFAALLITFATGGVIALALYIVFLFFDKKLYRDRRICILAAAAVAAGVGALIYALAQGGTWALELVWMIQKIIEGSDSYTDRVTSIFVNAEIFLKHPFVGDKISDVLHSVPNNTASSPILFASFGIVGGLLHVASWVALVWRKERSVLMNLILMVIVFVPFNTQNVIHDMFFWMFPIMALTERGLPLISKGRIAKKE